MNILRPMIVAFLFIAFLLNPSLVYQSNTDYIVMPMDAAADTDDSMPKTTTTSVPTPGHEGELSPSRYQTIIQGVPPYIWHRGCSPTAGGMILGYYDSHGYPDLIDGAADTQTSLVNTAISSPGNWGDYCLPMDSPPDPVLPDLSEPPVGDEHSDNCIADFMKTSQSFENLHYGHTWVSDTDGGIEDYVYWKAPHYTVSTSILQWGALTWSNYCAEIDANRPVLLMVDADGDGQVDHAITGIGYDNYNHFGCYDTWDSTIHWHDFSTVFPGNIFGVWGAMFLTMSGGTPVLDYSPTLLNIGDILEGTVHETSFDIWNAGAGTLSWMLSDKESWVTYNPATGSSTGETETVSVFVDTTGLSPGTYVGEINISSNGGSNNVTIVMNVLPNLPQLAFTPSSHDFGMLPQGAMSDTICEIWNNGTGTLHWSGVSGQPWITFTPESGTSTGNLTNVTITVTTDGLPVGDHTGCIDIVSDGGNGTFQVTCTVQNILTRNYTLYTDWNLITVPLQNTWTAETLGENITGCTMVIKFNASAQSFATHIVGTPWDDFPVTEGTGYYLYMENTTSVTYQGFPLQDIPIHIYPQWNMIGWYQGYSTTAEGLGDTISGCTMVIMFDADTQTFKTHIVGTPWDNFTIEEGDGVFIYTNQETWWQGEG